MDCLQKKTEDQQVGSNAYVYTAKDLCPPQLIIDKLKLSSIFLREIKTLLLYLIINIKF